MFSHTYTNHLQSQHTLHNFSGIGRPMTSTLFQNCETVVTPLLNKEILKMSSFTPYNRKVDTEFVEIQNVLVNTTALAAPPA